LDAVSLSRDNLAQDDLVTERVPLVTIDSLVPDDGP